MLCGHEALDQPVRWVHAGEGPNIASLLKGRELLLTTGIGIDTTERGCRKFVDKLVKQGVAGIAIELGSTLEIIPSPMVERARKAGLPIIALHRELPFMEVTEAAHQAIVNHHFELLNNGDELQRRFIDLALNGAGIPKLLSVLAETVANPVVLEKAGAGVAYHAVHNTDEATVLGVWEASQRRAPAGVDIVSRPVAMGDGERWGTLMVFALDSPIDDLAPVAVERATGIVALILKQEREEAVLTVREHGSFFDRLLSHEIDDAEASVRLRTLGFTRPTWPILTVGITSLPYRTPVYIEEYTWALVWRDLRRSFSRLGRHVVIGDRGDSDLTLALVAVPEGVDREQEAESVAQTIEQAVAHRFGPDGFAVVAVGRVAHDWDEARLGLREVEDTVLAATQGPRRPWHDATLPDIDRLLWSLRDHSALKSFAYSRLKPLVDHDRVHKSPLLPTLRTFCECAGRKSDAARALFVERQTLYQRLARIESLLGVSLSDGEAVLGIHLAIRVEDYLASHHL